MHSVLFAVLYVVSPSGRLQNDTYAGGVYVIDDRVLAKIKEDGVLHRTTAGVRFVAAPL